MINLKDLLKESLTWKNRKFGDRLPTLEDYKKLTEKKELGGAMINIIDRLTDSNNHNEARLQLAKSFLGKNSPLVSSYEALITLHSKLGDMNTLMKAREKLDKMLFNGAKRVYSDYDAIKGAF